MIKKIISSLTLSVLFLFLGSGITATAQTDQTIVEIASNTPELSTLVSALQAAELVDTLAEPGPYTVFAPTNEAFEALGGTLEVLLLDENQDLLRDILLYHVVEGEVDSATALTLPEAASVEGSVITLSVQNDQLVINDVASIVQADVDASNGVVHIIDSVLLSETLSQRVQTAVQAAAQTNDAAAANSDTDTNNTNEQNTSQQNTTLRSGGSSSTGYVLAVIFVISAAIVSTGISLQGARNPQ